MAGQPQEPSWTPGGQEQTQARPAWPQQPTFTPPAPGQQDAYGYPQQPAQGGYAPPPPSAPQPGYAPQEPSPAYEQQQVYGQEQAKAYGQEQAYAGQDQAYAGQDQTYAGQGQQYQPQPGPDPTQWQSVPGLPTARAGAGQQRSRTGRGFFASLFDFSFTSMVTPKIIKVLYVLFTLWTALVALVILIIGFKTGGMAGGLVVLIIVEPIVVLLMLGIYRVILEAFMVVFRIYEETVKIREQGERQL
jgi:hypothetical protein